MSGFVGWKLDARKAVGTSQAREPWPSGAVDEADGLPLGQGILWNPAGDPISIYIAADGWAVLHGRPRWLHEELAQEANRSSDAGAALTGFRSMGESFIQKLAGSYSLAIVDEPTGSTLLTADRFATRPIFYSVDSGGEIIFGSDLDAVRLRCREPKSVDPQSVYDYFFFHVVPSPKTIYGGIEKLGPAEIVVHKSGQTDRRSHWRPHLWSTSSPPSREGLSGAILEVLESSVRRCGPTDGFGAYLSGGLDSSAVAGFLSRVLGASTPAYCVGFAQHGYDEMEFARVASNHFDLSLREIYATPADVAELFPKLAAAYDEPFGNSSAVPAYLCARRAAEDGVHSLLAGDGGDELFGGNERYVRQALLERYWAVPPWCRRNLIEPSVRHLSGIPLLKKLHSYVQQASMPMPDRLHSYNLLSRIAPREIFEQEFLAEISVDDPFYLLRSRYDAADTDSLLSKMLYLDWKFTLADNDLPKVCSTAEMAGISVYFPMLDEALVDLSIEVPDTKKIVGSALRKFYKDAMTGFLPEQVINKKKHGFGLPFGEWLSESPALKETIFDSLSTLRKSRVVRAAFIDELLNQRHKDHAAYYGNAIWVFAMFAGWLIAHEARL